MIVDCGEEQRQANRCSRHNVLWDRKKKL